MVKETINLLRICGIFLFTLHCVTCNNGQHTAAGHDFVILVPPMPNTLTPRVILHIYSKTHTQITLMHPEKLTWSELKNYEQDPGEVILSHQYMLNSSSGLTTPIVLKGLKPFSVMVQLYPSNLKMASFQALPVDQWGQSYQVVTADMYPVIQLVSARDKTQLMIHLKMNKASERITFRHKDKVYKNNDVMQIRLNPFEGFTISNCNQKKIENTFSFTGSKVEGSRPFGLISGNCLGVTKATQCDGTPIDDYYRRHDLAAEMMMPATMFGWSNIVFPVLGRVSDGLVVIVANKDDTKVISSTMQDDVYQEYYLKSSGDHRQIKVSRYPIFLKSNYAILVVLFQTSPCRDRDMVYEEGGVAMSLIIPIELFHSTYWWRTPEVVPLLVIHYVCIVAKRSNLQEITLDNQAIAEFRDVTSLYVRGVSEFTTNTLKVSAGAHQAEGGDLTFGCYVYGSALNSYMNVPGYKTSISCPGDSSTNCSLNTGQELDNFKNFSSYSTKPPGQWVFTIQTAQSTLQPPTESSPRTDTHITDHGEWGQWMCMRDCLDQRMIRIRHCDPVKVCPSFRVDYKNSQCNDPVCPSDCVRGTWGQNCIGACFNCISDCDKFNGSCHQCKPGYSNNVHGCKDECPRNTYGEDCKGDCLEKCGTDCEDKRNGACQADVTELLYMVSILFISVSLAILLCCRKRRKLRTAVGFEDTSSATSKPRSTFGLSSMRDTTSQMSSTSIY